MGIEEVFIDSCPGCKNVVPGIVTLDLLVPHWPVGGVDIQKKDNQNYIRLNTADNQCTSNDLAAHGRGTGRRTGPIARTGCSPRTSRRGPGQAQGGAENYNPDARFQSAGIPSLAEQFPNLLQDIQNAHGRCGVATRIFLLVHLGAPAGGYHQKHPSRREHLP